MYAHVVAYIVSDGDGNLYIIVKYNQTAVGGPHNVYTYIYYSTLDWVNIDHL